MLVSVTLAVIAWYLLIIFQPSFLDNDNETGNQTSQKRKQKNRNRKWIYTNVERILKRKREPLRVKYALTNDNFWKFRGKRHFDLIPARRNAFTRAVSFRSRTSWSENLAQRGDWEKLWCMRSGRQNAVNAKTLTREPKKMEGAKLHRVL